MNDETNELDDFINFDDDGDIGAEIPELPTMVDQPNVQVQTSTGAAQIVLLSQIDGEPTVASVMQASGLFIGGAVSYFVDAVEVQPSTALVDGQILTVVGNVKGA